QRRSAQTREGSARSCATPGGTSRTNPGEHGVRQPQYRGEHEKRTAQVGTTPGRERGTGSGVESNDSGARPQPPDFGIAGPVEQGLARIRVDRDHADGVAPGENEVEPTVAGPESAAAL